MRLGRMVALTAAFAAGAGALYPCGGPEYYPIGAPFAGNREMLERTLELDYYNGPFDPHEVSFIYPIELAHPGAAKPVALMLDPEMSRWLAGDYGYGARYRDSIVAPLPSVSLTGFLAAIGAGDLAAAAREARGVVETVLDMPPPLADFYQPAFRRAVEFLELAPLGSRIPAAAWAAFYRDSASSTLTDYPEALREAVRIRNMTRAEVAAYADSAPRSLRAPSLRLVALLEQMKREIPNGWPDEIRKAATPELWQRLHAAHDRWLADFPDSPLADLVRFSRLRLYYLAGESGPAWQLLLGYYPERRAARAIWEMRFAGPPDSAALAHPHFDGALRAATVRLETGDSAWCGEWRNAVSHRPAPWALNIEERLLFELADRAPVGQDAAPITLPTCFPAAPAVPSQFWGKTRMLALLAAGNNPGARAQLKLLRPSAELAPLDARFALEGKQWAAAILTPALDTVTVLYLVRVLAPERALAAIPARSPLWIRREAALARAIRLAAANKWAGGAALLQPVDAPRAARWREAGRLAADASYAGRLAFARFLAQSRGRLMYGRDIVWHRSVTSRIPPARADSDAAVRAAWQNPLVPDEADRIRRHLLQSTEDYLALGAFAEALDAAPAGAADLAAVVKEADGVYRSLVDMAFSSTQFWYNRLVNSPEAAAIRRAGRRAPGS